ncbi:hypothetical protein D3C76_1145530 [compost metagenome]
MAMVDVMTIVLICSLRAERITPVRNSAAAVAARPSGLMAARISSGILMPIAERITPSSGPITIGFLIERHISTGSIASVEPLLLPSARAFSRSRISRQNGVISTEPQAIDTATESDVAEPSPSTLPKIGRPSAA